ncbi:FlgN family protein [Pirellula staleyi DSM 6068]|uniref:FlgN family protein n=1 Tax=Pirellula staleyi (strain ATCC 27377 / DSM 6068 / ICPB 4128) TaxID=530564 RepID=D2R3T3_PIRSD|nr:flagellar export chaperone FlgN [Pirellula staleyi]ADB17037.1 FlgN family protein [Pirellula staleyi DSM 6068]
MITSENMTSSEPTWEQKIGLLLDELSSVQSELLGVLSAKRDCLARLDLEQMHALQSTELEVSSRLEACHAKRNELLATAAKEGLPHDSITQLSKTMPARDRKVVEQRIAQSSAQMRLLQHQSLTNWVAAQRALLHVSQLLEIIATGGRPEPTYGDSQPLHGRGSLVNQEA